VFALMVLDPDTHPHLASDATPMVSQASRTLSTSSLRPAVAKF